MAAAADGDFVVRGEFADDLAVGIEKCRRHSVDGLHANRRGQRQNDGTI